MNSFILKLTKRSLGPSRPDGERIRLHYLAVKMFFYCTRTCKCPLINGKLTFELQ